MARRRVSGHAQRGPQASPARKTKKQTTSTRTAKPGELRRSARLKARQPQETEQPSGKPQETEKPSRQPQETEKPSRQPQETEKPSSAPVADPVQSWVQDQKWPPEYFEPDDQAREELLGEHDSWIEEIMAQPPIPVVQYVEIDGFRYPLPSKKVPASLRRKQSQSQSQPDPSVTGFGTPKNRDSKSVPYRNPQYEDLLEAKGSFLREFNDDDPPKSITTPVRDLLDADQSVPQNSLFRDDLFRRFCREIAKRNEAMIVQDLSRLLVPSAKNLAIYGDRHLDILIENVNEAWTECIPVEGPRPQPDYSVGFQKLAFTNEQLQKLTPLIGSVFETSFFVATYRMYFPFLTCEAKCGAAALDIANRQNAHSMTVAVRSVVELYRAVGREKELDREILAFSFSHDHQSVRIYGHYPVVDEEVTYYRHLVHAFDITALGGKDKWTAYKFTKSVYNIWMPKHLKRICSAIDQIPSSINFQISERLSQKIDSRSSDVDVALQRAQEDDEPNPVQQIATPKPPVSQGVGQGAAKRAKKTRVTEESKGKGKG